MKLEMVEVKIEDIEILEETETPSWGIFCPGGTFGIFC